METILLYVLTGVGALLLTVLIILICKKSQNGIDFGKIRHYRKDVYVNGGVDLKTGQVSKGSVSAFNGMNIEQYDTIVIGGENSYAGVVSRIVLVNRKTGERYEKSFNDMLIIGRGGKGYESQMLLLGGDKSVSGMHCRIFRYNGALYAEDMNSANHTYLNGEYLSSPKKIHNGDILKLGKSSFRIEIG